MVVLGLALVVASLGAATRIGASESATPVARRSTVDQSIARWTERTAVAAREPDAWTSLGDAFMQKARETADPSLLSPRRGGVPQGDGGHRATRGRAHRPGVGSWRASRVRAERRMGPQGPGVDPDGPGAARPARRRRRRDGRLRRRARALPEDARRPPRPVLLQPRRPDPVADRRPAQSRLDDGQGRQGRRAPTPRTPRGPARSSR